MVATASGPLATRHLRRIYEPVAPPAGAEQPGVRVRHFGRIAQGGHPKPPLPAAEPAARRTLVQLERRGCPVALPPVFAGVQQHRGQGVADLAGRPEHPQVVAAVQDAPGTPEDPIRCPRQARGHGLHSSPERLLPGRLDEQVHVVALHRVLDHAEVAALARLAEASPERFQEAPAPQGGEPPAEPKGNVRRTLPRHRRTSYVMDRRSLRRGLRPAPGRFPPQPRGARKSLKLSCFACGTTFEAARRRAGEVQPPPDGGLPW